MSKNFSPAFLAQSARSAAARYQLTPCRLCVCAGLLVCAAGLSLNFGGSAGMLALFAIFFWLVRREWAAPTPAHARLWLGVYALLLSAALCTARLVHVTVDARGEPAANYIDWASKKDLVLITSLAVGLWLLFFELRRQLLGKRGQLGFTLPGKRNSSHFFVIWGFIFLCWVPYLLAYWPAGLVGDGAHTLEEALQPGIPGGNHWVVLYILTLRFFVWLAGVFGGGLSVALCLYAVAQSLAFSTALAAVVRQIEGLGAPRPAVAACAILYGCSGFFASYGMVTWKDTLFSAAVVLLALQLWRFACRQHATAGQTALFVLTLLFLCFWRNNGLYIVVPTLLVLGAAFRRRALGLLGAGLAAVVFTMAVQGPGYDALGIEKDGINESASIPLQQVAAVIQADRPLSEEQQDVLFTILPEKTWKENYCPQLSDDLKGTPELNRTYFNEHFGDFLRVWAQLLPANLDIYVEAYLLQTNGFWMPGSWHGGYYEFFQGVQDLGSRGIATVDWFQRLTGVGLQNILARFTRFVSAGTMAWVLLGAFFFCLAKPRGQRKGDLLFLTPLLFSWLTLMISTPIAHSYRYVLMLPIALPLLCLLFVYDRPLCPKTT